MPFNEQLPQWDAPGVEPPASKKSTGWQAGEKPPADYWNWQMHRTYKALEELQQKAAEKEDVATKADLAAHTAATTGVHGATSTATPNTLVQRDSAGRFKAAAPSASDDVARKDTVDNAIAALRGAAPGTLDTLAKLAQAIANDPNFAATINAALAGKLSTSGDTMMGSLTMTAQNSNPNAYSQPIYMKYVDSGGTERSAYLQTHPTGKLIFRDGVNDGERTFWHSGNLLYETGNFTPFVFGSTTAGTIPYSYQTSGRYMKIQNRIFVEGTVRADGPAIVQPTGDLYIGGLPYVIRGEASNLRSPAFTIAALIRLNLPDNGYMIVLEGVQGQSVIRVRAVVDSNEMANVSADDQSFTNAWHIRFSGWYETN